MKLRFTKVCRLYWQPLSLLIPFMMTEGSPHYVRPSSRASGKLSTHQSINSISSSVDSSQSPPQINRPLSIHSVDRRPLGPRSPSPLPPLSPGTQSYHDLPSMDEDLAESTTSHQHLTSSSSSHYLPQTPGIKRSNRQPLFPAGNNANSTPKSTVSNAIPIATPIEPLSIKKKTSLRNSALPTNSPTPVKKTYTRHSPLSRTLHRVVSPRRVSPQVRKHKPGSSVSNTHKNDNFEQLEQLAVSTKEDVGYSTVFAILQFLIFGRLKLHGEHSSASDYKLIRLD